THLGKTLLFTDNADWSNEEIVLGYRAQHHIETAFRDMKNPHFLGWSPMFHQARPSRLDTAKLASFNFVLIRQCPGACSGVVYWTDSKIRVHAFYCVLALTLTS